MNQLRNQSVLVLGLGETGLSMLRYLSAQGARLRAADSRSAPAGVSEATRYVAPQQIFCGAFSDTLFDGIDLIAISPGVPLADPVVARAVARGIPVVGDIELFAQHLKKDSGFRIQDSGTHKVRSVGADPESRIPNPAPKIIAITGANGKTTVTSMVGAMCQAAGLDTQVAGNISPAVLDALRARDQQPQAWVLELSSFQLETTCTLNADAAVVLNVTEDHLDRYDGSMEGYAAAKARIFQGRGVQVVNRDDARSESMRIAGRTQVSFGLDTPARDTDWGIVREGDAIWLVQGARKIMRAGELQLSGLHNVANALAALALCRSLHLPLAPLVQALRDFKGLPHRMEMVAELNGITYYDDSKGTNVGATEAALKGLGRPAVVILGGDGKGQDFTPLKEAVAEHARAAVLIGRDAPIIEAAITGCGKPVLKARDMDEAVRIASATARHGDAVLLSPACASFDMFRNYEHRAQMFIAAVKALTPSASPLSGGEAIKAGAWSR